MPITLNGTTGITSPGGDTSTSLSTGSLVVSGTSNTSALTVGNVALGAGNATRFKNRIINGDMRIDQRNAGASVTQTTSATYVVDRFFIYGSVASKFTAQQNAGSVTPPAGYINYLGITSSSAYTVGASEEFWLAQRIEGLNIADLAWGTANAKTVTLSFQIYSSLTGTFGGVLKNSAGNRSYPFTYTVSSASTWTSISITVAGDTTGTWLTTNGIGLSVIFGLGVGSTGSGTAGAWAVANYNSATGATSVVGTNGATFYITGVQLEVGSSATGFEYVDYGTQLVMCQRYCQLIGTGSIGRWNSSTQAEHGIVFKTTMRTTPSVAAYTQSASVYNIGVASTTTSSFSPGNNGGSATGMIFSTTMNSWGSASSGSFFALATDAILLTAEL